MSFTITLYRAPSAALRRLPAPQQSTFKMATAVFSSSTSPVAAGMRSFSQRSGAFATTTARLRGAGITTIGGRVGGSGASSKGPFMGWRFYSEGGPQHYGEAVHAVQPPRASLLRRVAIAGAVFGGSLLAVNLIFNRETREDGGMPPYERQYLNSTFMHVGVGLGTIALTVRQMVSSGFVFRIMSANPWVFAIGGLGLSFATIIGTRSIAPDNYLPKYAMWTAFNVTQAAMVAPMIVFFPPALLARAGLYTVAMMGSLAVVGATAKQEKYLYLGGPLLAGCAVVLMSGLAPLVVPVTAVRTLSLANNIWLYGGLALFGGFTLYDIQKILHHARLAERGLMRRDPVNETISLELDFINIFIRFVQILGNQRRK